MNHLEAVHAAEAMVDRVEQTRDDLRGVARSAAALTGPPAASASARPAVVVAGLGLLAAVPTGVWATVAQPAASGLGVGRGAIESLLLVSVIGTLAAVSFAVRRARVDHLPALAVVGGWLAALATAAAAVTGMGGLALARLVDGVGLGLAGVVHRPLVAQRVHPGARVRGMAWYRAGWLLGMAIGPAAVWLLLGDVDRTWRTALAAAAVGALSAGVAAGRLRPWRTSHDEANVAAAIRWSLGAHGAAGAPATAPDVVPDPGTDRVDRSGTDHSHGSTPGAEGHQAVPDALGFAEGFSRLALVPTARRITAGQAALGLASAPWLLWFNRFLEEYWRLDVADRAGVVAAALVLAATVTVGLAPVIERRCSTASDRALPALAGALCVGVVALWGALAIGVLPLVVVLLGIGFGALGVATAGLDAVLMAAVPVPVRPAAAASATLSGVGVGGVLGLIVVTIVSNRQGPAWACAIALVPLLITANGVRRSVATVESDLDAALDTVIEREELAGVRGDGAHLPLLTCRHVDFAYGDVQILFGVDFTVDDGEMVALLGTNGAGKSTLLRVISGLALPRSGSVRLRGEDITFVDGKARVSLGISQIPGGKATFGNLSVVDNLRLYGYSLGRDRRTLDAGIDDAFEAFPRLAERRNQTARTMSGGEQQMLALSKALLLRPQLLLIDELSLGLAPVVVGELLAMVRRINASGTAVVLVEQSVNVALSLVEHAYFMEKGEVRFDGSAAELLARPDLLRSVYLQGAGAATTVEGDRPTGDEPVAADPVVAEPAATPKPAAPRPPVSGGNGSTNRGTRRESGPTTRETDRVAPSRRPAKPVAIGTGPKPVRRKIR